MAENDGDMELTEALLKYATGQFDASLIYQAKLPMLSIASVAPSAFVPCAEYLTALDLSRNRLTSLQGLQCLKALQVLDVSLNRLTTVEHLQSCSALQVLHAEGNALAAVTALNCLLHQHIPKLRAVHLQGRDGSDANPLCSDRSTYIAFMKQNFPHVRCIDGHYLCKDEMNPMYVDAGNDREIELPASSPWIPADYFDRALLEGPKCGVIAEKAFAAQVHECKRVLSQQQQTGTSSAK